MAKVSPNSIENLSQDWGNDPNYNAPFSGEAVQAFIKSFLRNVTAAAWFDPVHYTMYFFASEEDRNAFIEDQTLVDLPVFSCPMSFNSTLYRVKITNNTGTVSINVATNAGTCPLSASYVVQKKDLGEENWETTQDACKVTILIDRGLTGIYEPLTEPTVYPPGSTISIDVFSELIQGMNRVKFQFDEENDKVSQSLVYTITLAELYVELFNNFWYQPILENDASTQRLGGFKIAGAGSKTLHIAVYNSSGTKVMEDISVLIGTTNAYVNTPYYYPIPPTSEFLDLPTGVYTLRVYVSTPAINSEAIEYNVMFVATEDVSTAKLVCINNVADRIYNFSNAVVCKYSVYNGNISTADIEVTFAQMNGDTVVKSTTTPLTGVLTEIEQTLGYEALWPGIEGTGYFIGFEIELGPASASAKVPLDNSTVFPPTPGYDFYMLAANRYNSEANKDKVINVADDSELPATWTDIDFLNGIDGWTEDDAGRPCLRIPAKCKFVLPFSSFNLLSGDNCTIELCYKVANVADYDDVVISISPNPSSAGFQGIRIKPTNITVHNASDIDGSNDAKHGTNLCDDETVHFGLTINPYYNGNNKLVKAYVNGCKNFLFEYTASAQWVGFDGNLEIGADKTDVFLYLVRHYPVALSDAAMQTNYINSLADVAERDAMNYKQASVLDQGATNVDYEAVKNNGYNFFVVQMTQGNGVPSAANGWGKKTEGKSILEMHFGAHPEWDFKIENVETMGQGTTSMNYYRWNIRWRIDKSHADDPDHKKNVQTSYVVERQKVGGSYRYVWSEPQWSKTVKFDGNNHPALMRITAKINQASSMQSHKIGATRAYTALHDAIGLENEAQAKARAQGKPVPVVAVYEYPAFGFEYDAQSGTYTFIGLFTIGPDKGDKPTFGYDLVKNTLISLEGTDHSQPLAKFAYPWIESNPVGAKGDVSYYYEEEGISINQGSGNYLTGLEIGNCHGKEIDAKNTDNKAYEDQPAIRAILDTELKPMHLLIWQNSTLIFPITTDHPYYDTDVQTTLANINAHLSGDTYADNFRKGQYNSRLSYADMQFWIHGDASYTLYYYDEAFGIYKPDVSLYTQNGTPSGSTDEEKNEWFKAQRRARFMASAGNYLHLDETIYHFVFLLIFGATDNFAKNMYPYKMEWISPEDPETTPGRWRWRQDDLDTLFDIDNSGRDSKPYQIEYPDTIGTTPYFAGSTSILWNLINECYWDDYDGGNGKGIRTIGQRVINAMVSLSGANNPYDGFVNYISQCFWGNAQDYFPESAYNVDCQFKYEQAWLVDGQNVPPLEQALGNHYSGERLWVRRRAVYMLSLFRYGPFGDYSDTRLGTISFRPTALTINPKPLMWLYPAMEVGQNTVVSGPRTQPGVACELSGIGDAGGNTTFYIQGTNYLLSLGNLKSVQLGLQDIGNITIRAAKLVELLIGSATAGEVTTNIPGVVLADNLKCLETIDFRNASAIRLLSGLANCTRLQTLLLAGTSITLVELQAGSKIKTLSLPASIQRVVLLGLKHLSTLVISDYSAVTTIHIEDCALDVFAIIATALTASSALSYIRVLWYGILQDNGTFADTIIALSEAGLHGLDADGSTVLPKPFVEGTIQMGVWETDQYEAMAIASEESYQTTLKKALSTLFDTNLYIIYDPDNLWIHFEDSAVESLCVSTWGSDGHLTVPQAKTVTSLSTIFNGNAEITSFDELQYFTGLTTIYGSTSSPYGAFYNCTSLESVKLPRTLTSVGAYAFRYTKLSGIVLPEGVTSIGAYAFANISGFSGDVSFPNLTSLGNFAFMNTPVKNLYLPKFSGANAAWGGAGDLTGTLTIKSATRTTNLEPCRFKSIVVLDNISSASTSGYIIPVAGSSYKATKIVRLLKNVSISINLMVTTGTNLQGDVRFVELLGTFTGSGALMNQQAPSSSGCIVHLGYDAVENDALPCTPANVCTSYSYISKIYVGDGSSPEHDNAILQMFTNDTDGWANYTAKLDTWYNYINSPDANPDYINP